MSAGQERRERNFSGSNVLYFRDLSRLALGPHINETVGTRCELYFVVNGMVRNK